jgi:hypothetical protein
MTYGLSVDYQLGSKDVLPVSSIELPNNVLMHIAFLKDMPT